MGIIETIRRVFGDSMPAAGTRVRAVWNGVVLAESDDTVVVEGNHYFPPDAISWEYLESSERRSVCPWKGRASYFDIVVDGERNRAAAWHYPSPRPAAAQVRDRVAFWGGVRVEQAGSYREERLRFLVVRSLARVAPTASRAAPRRR